jgi:hypothetical protein
MNLCTCHLEPDFRIGKDYDNPSRFAVYDAAQQIVCSCGEESLAAVVVAALNHYQTNTPGLGVACCCVHGRADIDDFGNATRDIAQGETVTITVAGYSLIQRRSR